MDEDRNYNPFEPEETDQQRDDRIGRMIRENVDKRLEKEKEKEKENEQ